MKHLPSVLTACILLVCLAACWNRNSGPWHDGTPLRGAISLAGDNESRALLCGYNYDLVKRFAKSSGRRAALRLAGHKEAILDSLRSGQLDIVVFPYLDSLDADSTLVWLRPDSCGVWVFPAEREIEAEKASEWLREFRCDPGYPVYRQPYFDIYDPMKRVSADFISPYDSLLRIYADTLGWDWKMLAALVYKESKFHIEARSPRGASGLMQLIPRTARHFGCHDPLDPEENIRAGVKMLLAVRDRYRKVAADPDELTKYTLAAYNAGTGRVKDCISYARHLGVDVSRWENVASVIPDMKHDSIAALHPIKLGTFTGGHETIYYVRRVRAYHERYQHICP